ncbi:MAG: hypothetical protein MSH60_04775 [Ruminococcus sp.]|nr:hypothetical protein [Ruminococcus sp.]
MTSRVIAERAGVRLSMINYCFGSRECLLFEAFSRSEKDLRDDPRIKSINGEHFRCQRCCKKCRSYKR